MGLWEFADYSNKELEEMHSHFERLEELLGENPADEDMWRELTSEINKRLKEKRIGRTYKLVNDEDGNIQIELDGVFYNTEEAYIRALEVLGYTLFEKSK